MAEVYLAHDPAATVTKNLYSVGWLLYTHESTQVGAGMSYVRGTVHTEEGELIASFTQEALIRPLRTSDSAITTHARL